MQNNEKATLLFNREIRYCKIAYWYSIAQMKKKEYVFDKFDIIIYLLRIILFLFYEH